MVVQLMKIPGMTALLDNKRLKLWRKLGPGTLFNLSRMVAF